ncbi:S1 RNA-binding domain-containing protein [Candidatus Woesearchaeota archaeon]|nr:S1 RNA-binding domain-containing protein [Candidatus Woesearchaeota archaeon]
MFYRKDGYPEEGELVLCTVLSIKYHSVFVGINEYRKKGMIHISEVAPGRIRNIRDYVKQGKVVVCKVLRVDEKKGHVDLSLRRVNDSQRRNKVNQIKHEKKSESIVGYVASQELKIEPEKLYNKIGPKIFKNYEFLFQCFEDVVEKDLKLTSLGIDKKTAEKLEEVIKLRIKPKEVAVEGELNLISYKGNGVEIIKESLKQADKVKGTEIRYLGGGRYKIIVKAKDYKKAESRLEESTKQAIKIVTENNGQGKFIRTNK